MRPDDFNQALHLLPADLYDRVDSLRPFLIPSGCGQCREIADAVEVALMAARYDEYTAAEQMIGSAEGLVADHDRSGAERCRLRWGGRNATGQVTRWAATPSPLVAATDASWKGRAGGIGYVVSDGRFGLRGWSRKRLDPSGPSRVLIHELRAVDLLLSGFASPPDRLIVLLDSTFALSYLRRWQAGDRTAMPPGYSLRPRIRSAQPTLVRLAGRLAALPQVSFQHVKGHAGHPLNEAADALSHMARRRVREAFDVDRRAYGLVDAFLRDWHTADAATRS